MNRETAVLYLSMRNVPRPELEVLSGLLHNARMASDNVHRCSDLECAVGHLLYTLDCERKADELHDKADKMHIAACAAEREADAQSQRNADFEASVLKKSMPDMPNA